MLSERENDNDSYSLGICGLFGKDKTTNPSRTERACLFWLPDESMGACRMYRKLVRGLAV